IAAVPVAPTPRQPVIKADPVVKVTGGINIDDSKYLASISDLSATSVDIQKQMLSALGEISGKLDRNIPKDNNQPAPAKPNIVERLPEPGIDVRRRLVF
ncbi:MAG: hypothetical protein Q9M11_03595, partial [Mariprofundaceae bacterium]|nr:hypothetical protein [Mariprofundaceae bacterium]